jgi:hypothetical protein
MKFWESYIDHAPGMDHDVIIIWKNFIGVDHLNVSGKFNVRHVVVSDQGRDIDAYFKVSKMFDYDAFVFLNSWSEIHKNDWLKTMHDAMRDGVGLVGAFSSLESHRLNIINKFRKIWGQSPFPEKFLLLVHACYRWIRLGIRVPPYPNFHVRTNGFMIRKEVMMQIHRPLIFDKIDAWKFESGHDNMTRQIRRMGYEIVCLDELKLFVDNRVRSK